MVKIVGPSGVRNDALFKNLLKKPLKEFLAIPDLLIRIYQSGTSGFTINEKTKSRSANDKKNRSLQEALQILYKPNRDIYIIFNNMRPRNDQVSIVYYPDELAKLL